MDATSALQTTLLILYFVTPAANGPKNESKRIWTLQSTSQIETPSPTACLVIGQKMIEDIEPVANLTVRAYCLCAHGDGTDCVERKTMRPFVAPPDRSKEVPTVQRLGPRTPIPGQRR